ncbi:four-carbon acid sugar kinase family protein, partial [Acinetobacter baumannii]
VLDLAVIRSGTAAIADAIQDAAHRTPIVCDAVTEDDLRLLSLGVIEARRRGKALIYRVGPPFVRARIGAERRSPLTT